MATFFPLEAVRSTRGESWGLSRGQLHQFPVPFTLPRGTPESTHFYFHFLAILTFPFPRN